MKARKYMAGIGDFFGMVDSALAVSAAVRNHRTANSADLQRLGIDPKRFAEIQRY